MVDTTKELETTQTPGTVDTTKAVSNTTIQDPNQIATAPVTAPKNVQDLL